MTLEVRQICFIMLFYTAASKLLQYPTLLSSYSGRDLLFSALISFAVQGVVVWAVSYLSSKTDKTFYRLMEDTFGKVFAKVVYGFFAAYFILVTIMPLFEQKLYVHAIFYDTTPSLLVFYPIFFFTVYAGGKGFRNIGRCADLCMPIFLLFFFPLLFMSLGEADFSNLLPVLKTPVKDVFGGSLKTAYFFAEPAFLLMFLGHFKYKKGDAFKITLSYAAGAMLVIAFLALFYGVYGELSPSRQFALSKTSLYFSAMDIIGRVDLFALYALEIVQLFALVIGVQLAVHCLTVCTGWNCPEVLSLLVNLALAAILFFFDHYFTAMQTAYANWIWIAVILFSTVLPASVWALRRKNERG